MQDNKITHWSQKILTQLGKILPSAPTEADFRRVIDPLLYEFCLDEFCLDKFRTEVGLHPPAQAEYTLATGRADAVFNRLVIEYERPGVLKKTPDAATRHAVQQVKDYIIGLAKKERHKVERLAGVAFVGTFKVPAALCTPGRFDRFCDLLEDSLRADLGAEAFSSRCRSTIPLPPDAWNDRAISLTCDLYAQMLDLHRRGMNGLWARLLKNNFAPLTVGQFDYVVGNPPWVNWENLPDQYRDSIKDLWVRYRLAGTFKSGRPRLGAVKVDISALMTYTVMDALLKRGGRLGFVITQSLFKTAGAGAGFRRLRIPQRDGSEVPMRVVHVDDMVSLNPFEGASNRTAVMVLGKGKPTQYPVPYTVWRKTRRGEPSARPRFTFESTLDEVTAATRRLQFYAEPVEPQDPTSPWLTARPKALMAVRKILGRGDSPRRGDSASRPYVAHEGVNTGGANAVYWVEPVLERPDGLVVVRNLTEGAKIKVDEVTEPIEPDLLYPLLRGRDVQSWRAEPSAWIIMTYLEDSDISIEEMQQHFPRTYQYLKNFEEVLKQRADYRHYFRQLGKPFFAMMRRPGTFAPWKVVWREVSHTLDAAVASPHDSKPTVADHTLIIVECSQKEEAHYLCSVLNSSCARLAVQAYIVLHPDPHILEHIRIPRYDLANPIHQRLAELSEGAHEAARREDTAELQRIEAEIDRQAAQVWGLTDDELREIQQSLRELAGDRDE